MDFSRRRETMLLSMGSSAFGSLQLGENERISAKKRRQEAYKKDLQLQMLEQTAARKRERIQDMNVNASGWLDPEKGPERLKPLGGAGFMTDRTNRESKVRPYHSLFNYDKLPKNAVQMYEGGSTTANIQGSNLMVPGANASLEPIRIDPPAGLTIQPLNLSAAPATQHAYPTSTQDAYNFYATRDIDRPAPYGSIIQPLSIPYVDNRPIIMPGRYDHPMESGPRYNPFQNYDGVFKDLRHLFGSSQLDNDRLRAERQRENDEFQRKMRRELEEERRKLMEQEKDSRRRIEDLRKEAEERRKEWERRMRELERDRHKRDKPSTAAVVLRPSSSTLLADMEDQRRRLIDERRKIEEMLRMQLRAPDYTEVKILKRPPPPPTPIDRDRVDARNLREFHYLKYKDHDTRLAFQRMYPEEPETNKRLENQQEALLRQQENTLNQLITKKPPPGWLLIEKGMKRPSWLDKSPTPFPHRLRQRDRLYTSQSLHGDLDRIYRKNQKREIAIDTDTDVVMDGFEKFRLRSNRPSSAETLADDTWLRPSSVQTF